MDLIVIMNLVEPIEIYRISPKGSTIKIKEFTHPAEVTSYISQIANLDNKINITFVGPSAYISKFIDEANNIEFVKAQ